MICGKNRFLLIVCVLSLAAASVFGAGCGGKNDDDMTLHVVGALHGDLAEEISETPCHQEGQETTLEFDDYYLPV